MTTEPFYIVERTPPVAWVYLNRPQKKNALNPPAWKEIIPIFDAIDQDTEIRVAVLSGKGSCFSAGIDLVAMIHELPEILEKEQMGGIKQGLTRKIKRLQEAITCVERCRKPVIAAVHGSCIGAGLDLATACDIRLCAEDAVFSVREAAVGFVADVGVLQRLPLIVGQGITRELAFTAKDIDAGRAKAILLVSEIFPTHEALMIGAERMAAQIADNSPLAVQATKEVLNFGVGKSVADGLDHVAVVSATTIPSHDLSAAMTAFKERKKPVFTGT